ncbi:hypothetical protein LJ753_03780 [Arthrobacter sp. zg-Y20]|uniref:hypothetical protein n=1 Tax=unclassified Arthrobacter TaxID=235627 RepID=UPI001D1432CF|nr:MULTISPECIES: hypothetical protein [unclassified Arthrobacter]MCC3274991.1 hypothetical protein [Arthrobacter sp. zg-Y20]MDK1315148.1 hypothetical protein [Arthrobacter sp. zg.Y20]WIB04990.1 hypothetical protein QNO06_10525 [Arthrobacter sp. zg-Y20]
MTNGPESAPRRSRRAADVPVDSPAGPRERESQQRARDREALRASKALAETQERRDNGRDTGTAPPTRRQLRLQQQRAAEAGTAAVRGSVAAADPAPAPVEPLRRERRRAPETSAPDVPAPAPSTPPSRRSARKAASPEAVARDAVTREGAASEAGNRPEAKPGDTKAAETGPARGADPNADVAGMSVEQALAARQALEGQARNHVAAMEAMAADDPDAVDQELLAQQKALAERAKVLNRRTEAIRKLSQENERRKPSSSDPTTAHNLAMVTPLEFVKVPGMEHPVMKAPPTSHVPIVTSTTPQVGPAGPAARSMPAVPANGPAQRPAAPRRRSADASDVRHSRILARADALVNAPLESEEAARPVGARSAFGLDPLDVMTAGLGRTRRLRFAVFGVAGLGTLALIVGVLMIVGGLGG